jgi:hypothetical protein
VKFIEIFQPLLRFIAGSHRRRSPAAPPSPNHVVTYHVRVSVEIVPSTPNAPPIPLEVDWNRGPYE